MNLTLALDEGFKQELQKVVAASVVEALGDIQVSKAKPYMTRDETCALLGIARNTLSSFEKLGLPVIKIGGKHLISFDSLQEFLETFEQ